MDILKCSALSAAEVFLLTRHNEELPRIQSIAPPFFILLIAQYIGLKLLNILIWPFYFSKLRKIPVPEGRNPFFGHSLALFSSVPGELEKEWMRKTPDAPFIRYLTVGNVEVLIPTSLRAIKDVLQTNCYSFVKPGYWWRIVGEIAGKGILFLEGEEHKRQRRNLIGPFSFANIKNLLPWFDQKAKELSARISATLKANPNEPIEVSQLLSYTTLDIVGLAVLGTELKSLSSSSPLADSYQKIFEIVTPLQVLITVLNQYIPIRSWLPLEANRAYVRANGEVRRILREQIRLRRKEYQERKSTNEKGSRDLLGLMIEETKDTYTEEEMLGYLLNFMSAGHETTSGALTWALYSLTLHPELQARLRQEINTELTSTTPTYAELENLKLLNNLFKEVLRYYPPSPSVAREAAEDVEIDGVFIPKGTLITIVAGVQHNNPTIWGPTADEFDPDRWDNLPKPAQDPYASEAFLNGPRVCIGKSFATLEWKAIMVELIRNFAFENTGIVDVQKAGVTLKPLGGMHLKIKPV
ncbi:cytochrome P450 3A5 [Xylogone sp. PMI_703]|nr:cytochrome P450 3A5 [Xylogone sp. PMI_703]